ncbi:hydrophobin 2 [Pyrrhoderma noxium]|uniref:Hydrophobin n=1 Tax=Pyrrhoderma noxium TaxID=2282107 RepID=A0A286UEF3_9AGAM|nr:hydrophobin 2 [Pyrrhoderma noxium]
MIQSTSPYLGSRYHRQPATKLGTRTSICGAQHPPSTLKKEIHAIFLFPHIYNSGYMPVIIPNVVIAVEHCSKPDPKPSATPTPKPKPPPASSCEDELVCCLTLESPSDISAALILGLLHIGLTSEQKKELVGLTCKDIDLTGHPFDNICLGTAGCCDKSYDLGIIAVGCSEPQPVHSFFRPYAHLLLYVVLRLYCSSIITYDN